MSDANGLVPLRVHGNSVGRLSRREAMQWVMAAAAASTLPGRSFALPVGRTPTPQESADKSPAVAKGYGLDPNLIKVHKPGDFWPLTFTAVQTKTAAALADLIIPKDDLGPAASEVGVVEMVDEWISAPYPRQVADRPAVLECLAWIEAESDRRHHKSFAGLTDQQKSAICDDVRFTADAKPNFQPAARSFSRFRSLCAAAYYATPAGWKAIGYVGNTPLAQFDGPPQEVLQKLGVTQTVK